MDSDKFMQSNFRPLSVRETIKLPNIPELLLVAGSHGLDKQVGNVTVYEIADAYKWVKSKDFLLTTFLSVPENRYDEIFLELSKKNISGIVLCYTDIIYGKIPQRIIDLANIHDIPLFTTSNDITYVDIMLPIMHALIDNETGQLYVKIGVMNEINKLLLKGTTFTTFLSMMNRFISKPLLLIDRDYEVVAFNADNDEMKNNIIHFIKKSIPNFIKKSNLIPIEEEKINYKDENIQLVAYPIISNKWRFGHLLVFDDIESISERTNIIIKQCIDGLSILFKKHYADVNYQHNVKRELFEIFSSSKVTEQECGIIEDSLSILGIDYSNDFRFIVLKITDDCSKVNDIHWSKRRYIKITKLVNYFYNNGICHEYEGHYILLLQYISQESFSRNLNNMLKQMEFEYNNVKLTVSPLIKETCSFNKYFHLTKKADKIIPRVISENLKILWAEKYEMFIHLFDIINSPNQPLIEWSRHLLKPLYDYDKEKNRDLLENLKLLLFEDMDVKKVAEASHLHKNTLQYRMKIIKKLLKEDPFHEKRFKYTLAIYIELLKESNNEIL